jgi:hypothetical protein
MQIKQKSHSILTDHNRSRAAGNPFHLRGGNEQVTRKYRTNTNGARLMQDFLIPLAYAYIGQL